MATFNALDVLLPSAGLNLTYFTVKLKKGEMGFGFDTFGGQEYGTQVWKRKFFLCSSKLILLFYLLACILYNSICQLVLSFGKKENLF